MDLLVSSQPPVRASARRLGRVADRAGGVEEAAALEGERRW